ncbi:hypothetical protein BX070DRAFT_236622 [Coemansia spiralis]|nr:hypothetical protein BX070DRAFT_236622 [Coemansia spiralis]
MAVVSSYIGNVTLAAHPIIVNTRLLAYQPVGVLCVAIISGFGNLLDQARARRSEISSAVGLCLGAAPGLVSLALHIITAGWWDRIYSADPDVVAAVAPIMPICSVFQLIDSITNVSGGVLRSIGRKAAGLY